jgi:hypothetical protein
LQLQLESADVAKRSGRAERITVTKGKATTKLVNSLRVGEGYGMLPTLFSHMARVTSVFLLVLFALVQTACDKAGSGSAAGSAVPQVAPPTLSPIELLPPVVDRQTVGQVVLANPLALASFQTDLFTQSNGVVDILWIIDDSGSMADERLILGNDFQGFLNELVAIQSDYQIGVTSLNDIDQGQLKPSITAAPGLRIITNTTPNATAIFQELTTYPTSRLHWDQGLRMGELALTPPNTAPGGPNDGFIRPNAALALIVVTNGEDASYGDPDYYTRFYRGVKGPGNERLVTFSTLGGDLPNGCTPAVDVGKLGGGAPPATRYATVSFGTGAVVGSICDSDFAATLLRIVQALNTLRKVFPLTVTPAGGTLTVTVNGVTIPQDVVNGWQYQASTNSVVFLGAYVPPPGAQIQILYAIAN